MEPSLSLPLGLTAVTEERATTNSVTLLGSVLGYSWRRVSLPSYFSVSMPPKRMVPVLASTPCQLDVSEKTILKKLGGKCNIPKSFSHKL